VWLHHTSEGLARWTGSAALGAITLDTRATPRGSAPQRWRIAGKKQNGSRDLALTTICICVGSRDTLVCGYEWRIIASGTSFYLRARYDPLAPLKVSLHGPDPRHSTPGYKLALDDLAMPKALTAGVATAARPGWLPCWFSGIAVDSDTTHVLRLRAGWDLFAPGVPSGPAPAAVKARAVAGLIPPPPAHHAVDVDVYVSQRRPFWPNERRARAANACLGPLWNRARQCLTAVAVKRALLTSPTPAAALGPPPASEEDSLRALGGTVDESGLLWICEQWMSRSALAEAEPIS
jgi:hypothetical protein